MAYFQIVVQQRAETPVSFSAEFSENDRNLVQILYKIRMSVRLFGPSDELAGCEVRFSCGTKTTFVYRTLNSNAAAPGNGSEVIVSSCYSLNLNEFLLNVTYLVLDFEGVEPW